jgi:exopolysaccharide production protein ExoZ
MCALQGIVHDAVRLGVSVLPASKSIVSIQVLRALAALAVLTYHVPIELSSRLGLHDVVPRFLIGAAGVDLFFVISGFIIVYASEMLFGRWDAPYVFFVRRLVRIVPLYWACTGLIVAYWMIARVDFNSIDISFGAITGSFLFLPYPRPSGGMMPVIMLGWTVNHEMFFYAAFAGVIFLSRRRTVLTVITLFAAIVLAGQVFKPLPPTITFWSDPIILEFCFGMLIAAAYREGMRLPRVAAIALILAGALGYLASGLWSGYAGSRVIEWGMPATAIVAGSVLSNELPSLGPLQRALAFLGDASYSLYLVHPIAFLALRRVLLPWIDPSAAPWLYALVLLVGPIFAAIFIYLLFEKPVTRWLQRTLDIRRGVRPELVAPIPTAAAGGQP